MRRFYFRLAGHLGKSVNEILSTFSARELTEWRLVEGIEPFGERRADWRAAVVGAKLLQVSGGVITAAELLADLTEIFEQPTTTIDDDTAREARLESAVMAWAGKINKS